MYPFAEILEKLFALVISIFATQSKLCLYSSSSFTFKNVPSSTFQVRNVSITFDQDQTHIFFVLCNLLYPGPDRDIGRSD